MIHWPGRKEEYPLAPLREAVIFPNTISGIAFGREASIMAVEAAMEGKKIVVATQREPDANEPAPDDMYQVGTLGTIQQVIETEDGINVLFEGSARVLIRQFIQADSYWRVKVERIKENYELTEDVRIRRDTVINQFKRLVNSGQNIPLETIIKVLAMDNPHELVNVITPQLAADTEAKQEILETVDMDERLDLLIELLIREQSLSTMRQQVENKTYNELTKTEREAFLREEMKTIQKELGDRKDNDYEELARQIAISGMPREIRQKAEKELNRLIQMPSLSPEISYVRTYLDYLVNLPWDKKTVEKLDLNDAKMILDSGHYGLNSVKDRILEYMAVQKLAGKTKGSILCFIGPPGTGKTSVGKSIAKALGRDFTKVSLGGIKDEAEIRGHRRTYVGAMPGRIMQGITNAGSRNPVFVLDEIDKVGADFRGDPTAALLEALDPEQNHAFSDHYLEVPFDLSDVIFITTANALDTIPPPLLDRMEMIEFSGYSTLEKNKIAKNYLIPKIRESHQLSEDQWSVTDEAIDLIITSYTREAGVRNLERELTKTARKTARKIIEGEIKGQVINEVMVRKYLGVPPILPWSKLSEDQIGLTTALAWTEAGGEILSVEAEVLTDEQAGIIITGHMGDVMKESAQIALSFAKNYIARYHNQTIDADHSIHLHMPSGAIPKDGPSAGIAMAAALISAFLNRPTNRMVALTGEITLQGRLMRVGGVKDKVLAAQRAGLEEVILPIENKNDIEELPAEIRTSLRLTCATWAHEAITKVLR